MNNATPSDNLQAKLDESTNGILELAAGTYNLNATLRVHTGTTIIGEAGGGTHIVFDLPGPSFGFELDANAQDISFENLDIASNHGIASMRNGSGYKNIEFNNNRFQHGGGTLSDGSLVYGITCTLPNSGTKVTGNLFHDSTNSVRSWCFFNSSDSNFDGNTFLNVQDGGQMQFAGANVSFSHNYATGLCNKLQEGSIGEAAGFKCTGNVAYNWQSTNASSMGLSLLATGSAAPTGSLDISENYIDLSLPGGKAGGVSGVVLEIGSGSVNCSDNILGGATAPGIISVDTQGVTGSGNRCFGPTSWGGVAGGEGGPIGQGTWTGAAPDYNKSLAAIPAPPANTNTYLGSETMTTPAAPTFPTGTTILNQPPATPAIAGLAGTSTAAGVVKLAWKTPLPAAGSVSIISTEGRQAFPSVAVPAGATSFEIDNIHPGWMIDFQITAGTALSAVASVPVAGVSTAAYTGSPSVTPPPKVIAKRVQTITNTVIYSAAGIAGPTVTTSAVVTTYTDGSTLAA